MQMEVTLGQGLRPEAIIDDGISTIVRGIQRECGLTQLTACTYSRRFICNGALRFHATRRTHVSNVHQTLCNRPAFLSFHRPMTAGASNNGRFFVLHILSPSLALEVSANCLSAYLSWSRTCGEGASARRLAKSGSAE